VDHVSPGLFSDLCGSFITTPAQVSQPFTVVTTGPGVQQGTVTGSTNASGVGTFRARINAFGQYNWIVTIVIQGVTRTGSGSLSVNSTGVACP
jgi:hypothetical protein